MSMKIRCASRFPRGSSIKPLIDESKKSRETIVVKMAHPDEDGPFGSWANVVSAFLEHGGDIQGNDVYGPKNDYGTPTWHIHIGGVPSRWQGSTIERWELTH